MSRHLCVIVILFLLVLTGCAAYVASPVTGFIYTDVSGPVAVTKQSGEKPPLRSGSASANTVLGLFATGDASIRRAALNGGISDIHYVDYRSSSLLGIYAEYTVTVYGNGDFDPVREEPKSDIGLRVALGAVMAGIFFFLATNF